MKFIIRWLFAALLVAALSSKSAYADTLNFNLTNSTLSTGTGGGTLTYRATVAAPSSNTGAVFLNGDSFNFTGPGTLDDSSFFTSFPLSLAPGANFTGNLFTVTFPANTQAGTYLGTFTLLGGSNGGSFSTLGTVSFSAVAVTPEPSSLVLSFTGLAGMMATFYRSRRRGLHSQTA